MALVIACVALAIAIVVVFVVWALMQSNREVLHADFGKEVELARKNFRVDLEQLKVSRENYDEAVGSYVRMRDRANAQFVTVDHETNRTNRLLDELERFTLRTLEYLAATGKKPLILRGGLYVEQIPVLEIELDLVDKFIEAVGADLMYRQDDGADGTKFYWRWPLDKAPRDLLDSLIKAVAAPCDVCGGDWSGCSNSTCTGRSSASPGAIELRAVLEALRDGGLEVLYLGPLILLPSKTGIQAGFLPPSFHSLTESQKRKAVNGPNPDDPNDPNLMAELGVEVILEFTR